MWLNSIRKSGIIKYINAGHNPPLIGHIDGTVEQLDSGGFPLGIIPNAEYELGETRLESGESLVIYSDGVTEAVNPDDEEFEMHRLINVISKNIKASAAGMRDKVESALSEFTKSAPANDDITLVIVKKK